MGATYTYVIKVLALHFTVKKLYNITENNTKTIEIRNWIQINYRKTAPDTLFLNNAHVMLM